MEIGLGSFPHLETAHTIELLATEIAPAAREATASK
jgi:hypothetical protein